MYTVRGRNAATATTADHALAALWNPHSTQRIKVMQWAMVCQTAPGASGRGYRFRRISARGTAGSTVTPVIASDHRYFLAPPSGALLDLAAYSVQPTLIVGEVGPEWVFAAVAGSALILPFPGGIEIPAGTGLAIIQVDAAAAPVIAHAPSWLEDW